MSDVSGSNAPLVDTLLAMTISSLERCHLEDREVMVARVAALAAIGAPPLSYALNIPEASEVGLTADDATEILIAVAPVIGTARTVMAAAHIAEGLGLVIALAEAELQSRS